MGESLEEGRIIAVSSSVEESIEVECRLFAMSSVVDVMSDVNGLVELSSTELFGRIEAVMTLGIFDDSVDLDFSIVRSRVSRTETISTGTGVMLDVCDKTYDIVVGPNWAISSDDTEMPLVTCGFTLMFLSTCEIIDDVGRFKAVSNNVYGGKECENVFEEVKM